MRREDMARMVATDDGGPFEPSMPYPSYTVRVMPEDTRIAALVDHKCPTCSGRLSTSGGLHICHACRSQWGAPVVLKALGLFGLAFGREYGDPIPDPARDSA